MEPAPALATPAWAVASNAVAAGVAITAAGIDVGCVVRLGRQAAVPEEPAPWALSLKAPAGLRNHLHAC